MYTHIDFRIIFRIWSQLGKNFLKTCIYVCVFVSAEEKVEEREQVNSSLIGRRRLKMKKETVILFKHLFYSIITSFITDNSNDKIIRMFKTL